MCKHTYRKAEIITPGVFHYKEKQQQQQQKSAAELGAGAGMPVTFALSEPRLEDPEGSLGSIHRTNLAVLTTEPRASCMQGKCSLLLLGQVLMHRLSSNLEVSAVVQVNGNFAAILLPLPSRHTLATTPAPFSLKLPLPSCMQP